jgi:hypothetical protein
MLGLPERGEANSRQPIYLDLRRVLMNWGRMAKSRLEVFTDNTHSEFHFSGVTRQSQAFNGLSMVELTDR